MIQKKLIHGTANFGNQGKRKIDKETENELREAFDLFDPNKHDQIDARELKAILIAFGIETKKEEMKKYYNELGKEISESINYEEFLTIENSPPSPFRLH